MFKALLRRAREWAVAPIREDLRHLRDEARKTQLVLEYLALPDRTVTFYHHDKTISLYVPNALHDTIQNYVVAARNFFEIAVLEDLRKSLPLRGANIIDAGANIGNHSIYFDKICGASSCRAFEPNPYTAAILRRNVALNQANVEVNELGLSDAAGTIGVVFQDPNNLGGTVFSEDPHSGIRAAALDTLETEALDFLKLDVERMGHKVIAGAMDTLSQFKPIIFAELVGDEYAAAQPLLSKLGYRQTREFAEFNYLFER